uniref:Protein kinase domain-containing protein n=1 Tax=Glossina brevipalpis TaxID=37001 RepID=A0A1A9WEJ9_9MUSC
MIHINDIPVQGKNDAPTRILNKYSTLTDFGYARYIPDHTKLQSIVGTPQYVAPEVIRDGKYNKTVDYWSIGIIAFEILYGIRPFIPHCEFYRIMKMIQKKPKYCIAIKEDFFNFNSKKNVQDKEEDKFLFIETISKQNNSSFIFTKKLEIWLRLALDSDYKSRGQIGNELKFYTELDTILNSKIITVFSLNSYQFLSYEVTQFMTKEKFLERLCQEIKIEQRNLYLILPLLHPKKSLKNISLAMDFYVKEWIDREPGTPLAMLYIMDIRQCDFNVKCLEFSSIVMNCMELSHDTCISLSKGLLEQFELDTHFLISNEQRHLEANNFKE